MRRFDYSFLQNGLLPASLVNITAGIATSKTDFPDVSPSTVEVVLGKMVKEGLIITVGKGRATRYIKLG